MASRKASGSYSGFAQRLDQLDPYEQAIMRNTDIRIAGSSSMIGSLIRETIAKSRKSHSEPIKPRFSVGSKVVFYIGIDNQWQPAKRLTGRVTMRFKKSAWYYVIQASDGSRYSLPDSKIIRETFTEIILWQPQRIGEAA